MKNIMPLIIVLLAVVGAIYYLESQKAGPTLLQDFELAVPTLDNANLAPELTGISGYLNTDGQQIQISDYRGKVVLIDFWTYTCINCIRTLPHLKSWHEKYSDDGLVIIGVHTPEFAFEKKRENVENAISREGIKYAVVQDNDYQTWRAFQNRYWPHKYLIDATGVIRYDHIGEGSYEETEAMIQSLLAEIGGKAQPITALSDETPRLKLTPELYAGYKFSIPRGQNVGNTGGLRKGVFDYQIAGRVTSDTIYLAGPWESGEDELTARGNASIWLDFTARKVNIVVDSGGEIEVLVDGEYVSTNAGQDVVVGERAYVLASEAKLYNVVSGEYKRGMLELRVSDGFSFNAFTFG